MQVIIFFSVGVNFRNLIWYEAQDVFEIKVNVRHWDPLMPSCRRIYICIYLYQKMC